MNLSFVSPNELKRIAAPSPAEHAALMAAACRLNALSAIKRAGSGHIGSSFSAMDIMVWLHLYELGANDLFFSSKGHDAPALYAVLAAVGKLDFGLLQRLRRYKGLPGHPDAATPEIVANTGSLGMGVSKAKGMILGRRLKKQKGRVFVMTGDGELQEGQFWESLPQAAQRKMKELTVIVDANGIQSDWWTEKVLPAGDILARARACGWHAEEVDGHDFNALSALFAKLRDIGAPKFIVARTVKGKGVSFMEGMAPEERLYRYHSGAPSDSDYQKAAAELAKALKGVRLSEAAPDPLPVKANAESLIAAYSRELVFLGARNEKVVVLDADLAKDCGLIEFEKRFPERFIECGIAEQDMVSQAGGLARQKLVPIVHSFACFLSARPNEQIYNNALEGRRVVYAASLAGLLPAGPGSSHQAVRDIGALGQIPGLVMIEPSHPREVAWALEFAAERANESVYLRLVSVPVVCPWDPAPALPVGRGFALVDGEDAVLIAYGPVMVGEALKAAALLREQGVGAGVINHPWLNRVDPAWLAETVGRKPVFVIDNHYVDGGLGDRITTTAARAGLAGRVHRIGLDRAPVCGANDEALKVHELDAASLARRIRAALGQPAEAAP